MRLLVLAVSLGSVVLALRIPSYCFSFVAIVRTSLLSASFSLFSSSFFFLSHPCILSRSPPYPIPALPHLSIKQEKKRPRSAWEALVLLFLPSGVPYFLLLLQTKFLSFLSPLLIFSPSSSSLLLQSYLFGSCLFFIDTPDGLKLPSTSCRQSRKTESTSRAP